ncbi:MAG: hypothetical protein WC091_24170 [Sulfuricellaceae bacterium]
MKRFFLLIGILGHLMTAQVFAATCTDADLASNVYDSLNQGMTIAQTLSVLSCDSVRLPEQVQSPGVTVQGYQWNSPNRSFTVTFRQVNGGQVTLFTKDRSGLLSDVVTYSSSDNILVLPKLSLDGTTNYLNARVLLPTGGNWSYLGASSSSAGSPDSATSLFTTASSALRVPSVTVDGAAFSNVWLYLPPSKPWSVLGVGTLTQPPLPVVPATFNSVSGQMVLPDLSIDDATNYTNACFSLPVGGASWAFQGGESKKAGTPLETSATFTSATGVLFVPSLIKDGVAVANAWYYLAPGKGWQELGVGTLTPPPLPVIPAVLATFNTASGQMVLPDLSIDGATNYTNATFSLPAGGASWAFQGGESKKAGTPLETSATFTSATGVLFVPSLIKNGVTVANAWYYLAPGKGWQELGIGALTQPTLPVTPAAPATFNTAGGQMVLPDLSIDGATNYINAKFSMPAGVWGNGDWAFQGADNKALGTPSATAATYNTSSGVLFVPSLSLNGTTVANAWYLLQPGQPWRELGLGSVTQPAVSTMRSPSPVHIPNYGGISDKSIFMTTSDADGSSAYWRGKSDCSFPTLLDVNSLPISPNQPAIIYHLDQEGYLLTIGGSSLVCGIEPMTVTP